MGFDPDASYPTCEVSIGRGDRLVLYTDGVVEVANTLTSSSARRVSGRSWPPTVTSQETASPTLYSVTSSGDLAAAVQAQRSRTI